MNYLRDSLTSISSSGMSNSAASGASTSTPPQPQFSRVSSSMNVSQSTPSSISGDEGSDKSHAIPSSLIKEQWQLILGQEATIAELQSAVSMCKKLVLESDEFSNERKWLVRHLVELRFRLEELEEAQIDPIAEGPSTKVILGHHFSPQQFRSIPTAKQYCDHCSGIIWSVVQASLICTDCSFVAHHKCVQNVIRICAHIVSSERKYPIPEICPEIGLAAQLYKCAECGTALNFKKSWTEPRLCDYSGLFYCQMCHWNDNSVVPARIIHNWDFTTRKVCRASLQEINLILDKPVIKLEEINPKLFVFLQKLSTLKKLREYLGHMRKYLVECRIATNEKFIETQIGSKRHLIQSPDYYSISDLVCVESGEMIDYLNKIFDAFNKHIRNCDICAGKGYICEICDNKEIIYPFDDGSVSCDKCNVIYHRACSMRKNMQCFKCIRLEKRQRQQEKELQDERNGNEK